MRDSPPPHSGYGAPRGGDWGHGGFRGGRGGYGGGSRGGGGFDRNGYGNPNAGGAGGYSKGGSGSGSFVNGVHTPGPVDPRAERELFGVETRQNTGLNFVSLNHENMRCDRH